LHLLYQIAGKMGSWADNATIAGQKKQTLGGGGVSSAIQSRGHTSPVTRPQSKYENYSDLICFQFSLTAAKRFGQIFEVGSLILHRSLVSKPIPFSNKRKAADRIFQIGWKPWHDSTRLILVASLALSLEVIPDLLRSFSSQMLHINLGVIF